MRKPLGGARHERRANAVVRRHMAKLARQEQQQHFEKLKTAIQGVRCIRHEKQCTMWWQVPDKGLIALCDDCTPERVTGDRVLRVLDPVGTVRTTG